MQDARPQRTGSVIAAVGAVVAAVGTFLPWAGVSVSVEGVGVAGAPGQAASGTDHWTGLLAVGAAVVVLAASAAGLLTARPEARRASGAAAAVGGTLIVVMAVLGWALNRSVLEAGTGASLEGLGRTEDLGAALGIPGLTISVDPRVGLLVTGVGGVMAAAGGAAVRGWSRRGAGGAQATGLESDPGPSPGPSV